MGTIWAGEHLTLRRRVAVKFIAAELLAVNPQARERFDREAQVLTNFRHPHVVELIASGAASDGTPYIVLELMEGEPLINRLERDGVFELDDLRRVVEQLADGLDKLHRRGVIHRDIKAENVFIAGEGANLQVKLFDFGLARVSAEATVGLWGKLTKAGMRVGTNEYMSPEQMLNAAEANHTADLWAVAVVAYLLMIAGFPFRTQKVGELFALISVRQFERPSTARDDVPAAVDAWFERCFEPQIDKRFTSAREMAAAFREAIAAKAAPAPQPQPSHPAQPFPSQPSAAIPPPVSAMIPPPVSAMIPPPVSAPPAYPAPAAPVALSRNDAINAASLDPDLRPLKSKNGLWIALGVVALILVAVAVHFLA